MVRDSCLKPTTSIERQRHAFGKAQRSQRVGPCWPIAPKTQIQS